MTVVGNERHRPEGAELPLAGVRSQDQGPTASCVGRDRRRTACRCSRTSRPRGPNAKLYGPDGVAEAGVHQPEEGRHPRRRRRAHEGARSRRSARQDLPAGQEVVDDYKKKYGTARPDPYAIYGYETMALVLDAIKERATRPTIARRSSSRSSTQGPQERPRHVLDRQERRHHAHRLRPVQHQGRATRRTTRRSRREPSLIPKASGPARRRGGPPARPRLVHYGRATWKPPRSPRRPAPRRRRRSRLESSPRTG